MPPGFERRPLTMDSVQKPKDGPVVSELDCQIDDRGTIPAPDFPFQVALPVHPAVNGYRDLPWKLNAAEFNSDHIASHVPRSKNDGSLTPTAAICPPGRVPRKRRCLTLFVSVS